MPFTGPGSKLAIQRGSTKQAPWRWSFHPPLHISNPKQLDGKGLSYSIPFAELHERAVLHSTTFAKVKEVSMRRHSLCREAWMLAFTSIPACHREFSACIL